MGLRLFTGGYTQLKRMALGFYFLSKLKLVVSNGRIWAVQLKPKPLLTQ